MCIKLNVYVCTLLLYISMQLFINNFKFCHFVQIQNLFPSRGSVNNITIVGGFRSNAQYGFMIGFRMNVDKSRVTESSIRVAQLRLRIRQRMGGVYLRSSSLMRGRGLRFFNETGETNCINCLQWYKSMVCCKKEKSMYVASL